MFIHQFLPQELKQFQLSNNNTIQMSPYPAYQVPQYSYSFPLVFERSYLINGYQPLYYQNFSNINRGEQIVKQQFDKSQEKKKIEKIKQLKLAKSNCKKVLWSQQQDDLLKHYAVQTQLSWKQISEKIQERNPKMCYNRYQRLLANKKKLWTRSEDNKLKKLVQVDKLKWKKIQKHFQNRNPKQLRERYLNVLRSNISRQLWSIQEDETILSCIEQFGKKWKKIENCMQYRTDNQIKNRFYGHLKHQNQN